MSKLYNLPKGRYGEEVGKDYLCKKGYSLLARNYRMRYGEIDLIFLDEDEIIFVEVKAKVGEDFGTPEEMVDKRKINQIQKTAQSFLVTRADLARKYEKYRIDVVAIVFNGIGGVDRIDHYENVEI